MIISIIQATFKIKIQLNMSEKKKKKGQRIYELLDAETKSKFICLSNTKQRNMFLQEKSFLGKGGVVDWTKYKIKSF